MKTDSQDTFNDHNLVMFPSSKNFKIDLSPMDLGHDPLNDLLTEYSHIKDEDIPSHLDDRFEIGFDDETDEGETFLTLDAFMSRNLRGETQGPDDRLINLINERIQAIKEAKERIKFYLSEIEMFLPNRKR